MARSRRTMRGMEILVPLVALLILYAGFRFWRWVYRSVNETRDSLKRIAESQGGTRPDAKTLMKPVQGKRSVR
jgi:hypothetical protein